MSSFSGFTRNFNTLSAELSQYLILKESTTVLLTVCMRITTVAEKRTTSSCYCSFGSSKVAFEKNSIRYSILCLCACFKLLLNKTQSVNISFQGECFEKL